MEIIQADLSDLGLVLSIVDILELDVPDYRWTRPDHVAQQLQNGTYLLGMNEGEIVGAMDLHLLPGCGSIDTLAIKPEFWGRGFGTAFVQNARGFARASGRRLLEVESFCEYGVAGFYKRQGFAEKPELGNFNGHPYHILVMHL